MQNGKQSLTVFRVKKFVAEREGFEPPEPRSSTVFKTAAIDHSAISPCSLWREIVSPKKRCKYIWSFYSVQEICHNFIVFLSSVAPVGFLNTAYLLSCFIYYFDSGPHKWNGIKKKSGKYFSGLLGFFLSAINGYSDSVHANWKWAAKYPSG